MASLTKPPFGGENHLLSQRCMFSDYFWLQNPRIPVFLGGKTWVKDVFVFFKKTSKLKFGRFQIGRYDTIKSEFLGTWAFSKDFGMRWVGLVFFCEKKSVLWTAKSHGKNPWKIPTFSTFPLLPTFHPTTWQPHKIEIARPSVHTLTPLLSIASLLANHGALNQPKGTYAAWKLKNHGPQDTWWKKPWYPKAPRVGLGTPSKWPCGHGWKNPVNWGWCFCRLQSGMILLKWGRIPKPKSLQQKNSGSQVFGIFSR